MKKHLLWLIALLLTFNGFAQDLKRVDSLLTVLKNEKKDTTKANILYMLSKSYWGVDPDKASEYAGQSLKISEQHDFKKGIANAYYSQGIISSDMGEFTEALELQQKALKINEGITNKPGIANAHNEIGMINYYIGNNPEALKNYFASIKINEESGNKQAAAGTYMNIGNVYLNIQKYDEALENHLLSLKDFKEIGFKRGIAMAYNNIGTVYIAQKNYPDALGNFRASLTIKQEMGDVRGIANAFFNIAEVNNEQNNYDEALKNYTAALKIHRDIEDKNGLASCYLGMAQSYSAKENLAEAKNYILKGLELSLKTGNKNSIKDAYKSLADINAKLKNYKEAYENEILFKQAYDSVFNSENENKLTQLQMQNDFDKKEAAIRAEQEKKDLILQKELQKQKLVKNGFIGGLVLVMLLLFFVYRNYTNQRTANKKLRDAQNQLVQSEKMAAFGVMAERVSHEILNPLNFINNFSELSKNLAKEAITAGDEEAKKEAAQTLMENLDKISHHGKRADSIVKQLQEHSRAGTAKEFFETS